MLVRACVLATPHPFVFSQLTHPKNDLQIIYSYFDFECRYVKCARQNHPGFDSKIMTTYERHLTYTKNKPKILLSSSYKTEEMALLCLQRKPLSIISIPQTLKSRLMAIKSSHLVFCHLKNKTPLEIKTALALHGESIKFVPNQKHEYCLIALQQTADAIYHIKLPNKNIEEYYWIAITKDPQTIGRFPNPSYELIMYALQQGVSLWSITYKKIHEETFVLEALKKNPFLTLSMNSQIHFTEKIEQTIIETYPSYVLYLPNPPFDVVLDRIKNNDTRVIDMIDGRSEKHKFTEEIYFEFIKRRPFSLRFCKVQSKRIVEHVIQKNESDIRSGLLEEKEWMELLQMYPKIFRWIPKKTSNICKIGLEKSVHNIYYIDRPTDDLVKYAKKLYPGHLDLIQKLIAVHPNGMKVYDSNGNLSLQIFNPHFVLISDGCHNLHFST